jgi:pimeloyl-ACP methyl ester carboxylesterase
VAASGDPGIAGFEYSVHVVGPTTYRPGIAGSGPPVLLLHGFPQTHFCWRLVAPALSERNTVVVCDLKGCGERRPRSSPRRYGGSLSRGTPEPGGGSQSSRS